MFKIYKVVWADPSRKQKLQKLQVSGEVLHKRKPILSYFSPLKSLPWRCPSLCDMSLAFINSSFPFSMLKDFEMITDFSKGKRWSRMDTAGKMEPYYAALKFECCPFPFGGLATLERATETQRSWFIPVLWSLDDTLLQTIL